MIENKSFAERVKSEISEEANPAYYEELLKKDTDELMEWIEDSLKDYERTRKETKTSLQYNNSKGSKNLGLSIVEAHFKSIIFVLNEIKNRVNK